MGGLIYEKTINNEARFFYISPIEGESDSLALSELIDALPNVRVWTHPDASTHGAVTGAYHTHPADRTSKDSKLAEKMSTNVFIRMEQKMTVDPVTFKTTLDWQPVYGGDINVANEHSINMYVTTPTNRFKAYFWETK